jgi:predicted transcriptional regulator of viral defense system
MRNRQLMGLLHGMGGTASAGELVDAGARWEDIYRLRDAGELLELSRGIYRLAAAPPTAHLDLVAVCRRVPHGTICLNSAASYWDLTDELPDHVHLAIPRGRNRPVIRYPPTRVHVFAKETFSLGRIAESVETGENIAISSPERTVVDLVRLRGQVGRDQALSALRRYLERDRSDPSDLLSLARRLRAGTVVGEALELLLA